jgi:hypothetical protein
MQLLTMRRQRWLLLSMVFLATTDTNESAQLVVGQFPQSAPALVRVVAMGIGWAGKIQAICAINAFVVVVFVVDVLGTARVE